MSRDMTVTGPTLSRPEWTNTTLGPEHRYTSGAKLDPSKFLAPSGFVVTVSGAGAAQNATSVPLASAVPAGKSIPAGTTLKFSGGAGRFAKTTAVANAGATSLAVEALPVALPAGVTADYAGIVGAKKYVPSGTPVSRTYTERDAGTGFHPAAAGDDEYCFTCEDVHDADDNPEVALTLPYSGIIIKEEMIPGTFAALASGVKSAIRARYVTIRVTELP